MIHLWTRTARTLKRDGTGKTGRVYDCCEIPVLYVLHSDKPLLISCYIHEYHCDRSIYRHTSPSKFVNVHACIYKYTNRLNVYLSIYQSIYPSIHLSIYLYLSIDLIIYIYLPLGKLDTNKILGTLPPFARCVSQTLQGSRRGGHLRSSW